MTIRKEIEMKLTHDEIQQIYGYEAKLIKEYGTQEWFPDLELKRKEEETVCYHGKNGYVKELITNIMTWFLKIFQKKNWKN
jgi:hypothetical protein